MRSDNVTKGSERAPNRSLFYALGYTPEELERRKQKAAERYTDAGADLVIDSIRDLPAAVSEINRRMAEKEAAAC